MCPLGAEYGAKVLWGGEVALWGQAQRTRVSTLRTHLGVQLGRMFRQRSIDDNRP